MSTTERKVSARVFTGGTGEAREETVVVEEPLAIRISGETVAVTMRTPGADRDLVLGFLLAEGVIASAADVASLAHCGKLGDEGRENTMEVVLAPGVKPPVDAETGMLARRGTIVSSACGVCGRVAIDDLVQRMPPLAGAARVAASAVSAAMRALRDRQPVFAKTGGCHAASLVTFEGEVVATAEDVGRHNAVDKVVGARMRAGALPLAAHVLLVSGRASFEIVQKAWAAGVPVVASVSAPSSLAVELATRAGVTLVGFVREDRLTVYAGEAVGE